MFFLGFADELVKLGSAAKILKPMTLEKLFESGKAVKSRMPLGAGVGAGVGAVTAEEGERLKGAVRGGVAGGVAGWGIPKLISHYGSKALKDPKLRAEILAEARKAGYNVK